jgi:lipoate-protein ligase B
MAGEIAGGVRPPTLLLLEHSHTYTFGRRGNAENLLWDEDELARRGVSVHWVDRGGDVTYHGPGQLVGYPLLPLAPIGWRAAPGRANSHLPQADYVDYLRQLEATLIAALATLGIVAQRLEGITGVWVQPPTPSPAAKIAAIGVKVDARGITRHGFALNVNPDMTYWQGIIGCGLKDHPTISLAELLDPAPSMETVMDAITVAFGRIFEKQMVAEAV